MAKRFIQVVFITMPTPAPAGRRPRVRLRSTTIAYRNHRDDTKTRDAPPASPRSRVDGRGHAAGRSLPPPSPPARAPIRYRALATTRRVSAMLDRPPTRIFRCRRRRPSVCCPRVPRATAPSRSRIFPDDIPGRNPLSTRPVLSLTPPPSRLRIDHLQPCRLRRSAAPEIVRRSPSQRDARRLSAPREERADRKARHPSSS